MIKTLSKNENLAISDLKQRLVEKFGNIEITLFGSKSRGDGNRYSDIDILVLLDKPFTISVEEEIFDLGFEIELKYDVVVGITIYSKEIWNSLIEMSPFCRNVVEEGIPL
jgi:hypothetical protein